MAFPLAPVGGPGGVVAGVDSSVRAAGVGGGGVPSAPGRALEMTLRVGAGGGGLGASISGFVAVPITFGIG